MQIFFAISNSSSISVSHKKIVEVGVITCICDIILLGVLKCSAVVGNWKRSKLSKIC